MYVYIHIFNIERTSISQSFFLQYSRAADPGGFDLDLEGVDPDPDGINLDPGGFDPVPEQTHQYYTWG